MSSTDSSSVKEDTLVLRGEECGDPSLLGDELTRCKQGLLHEEEISCSVVSEPSQTPWTCFPNLQKLNQIQSSDVGHFERAQ